VPTLPPLIITPKVLDELYKLETSHCVIFCILLAIILHHHHHHYHHHHHHHMALQPNSAPGLPLWGFVTLTLLQGWIVSPAPNPQPGEPGLRIYDPRRQGGPAIPPGTGYPF
jgi:hypothetical protein